MTGFFLSADADEDLQDIYLRSVEVWGERQAQRYLASLFQAFDLLGHEPSIGRSRPDLHRDVRSFPHGSHIVFFMEWEGEIAILRVLHGRRDIDAVFESYDPLEGLPKRRPS